MVRSRQVGEEGVRVIMGTLTGGVNVHESLVKAAVLHNVHTATFELLGGLHEAVLTAYDFERQIRMEPLVLKRPLEIIAGHGTISQLDGKHHVHLHLTLSFRNDKAAYDVTVVGGHAAKAIAFAVEFTMTAYDGTAVQRGLDNETGLMLWDFDSFTNVS
ncbi:MAG: DUF296 domain-containing protein [Chloroflexota bacterium]